MRLTEELDLSVIVLSGFPHLSNHDALHKSKQSCLVL